VAESSSGEASHFGLMECRSRPQIRVVVCSLTCSSGRGPPVGQGVPSCAQLAQHTQLFPTRHDHLIRLDGVQNSAHWRLAAGALVVWDWSRLPMSGPHGQAVHRVPRAEAGTVTRVRCSRTEPQPGPNHTLTSHGCYLTIPPAIPPSEKVVAALPWLETNSPVEPARLHRRDVSRVCSRDDSRGLI